MAESPDQHQEAAATVTASLTIERRGALVDITLNRPEASNALNDEMRAAIVANLHQYPRDPDVYALVFRSSTDRAFCAGGDVRQLARLAAESPDRAAASIAAEYRMNWALECFSKPAISLIDGMVMGSGVGLVQYGTHRVAGKGFRFSMPETAIGLFPDVGVSHMLSRLPGSIGRYLGLTGRAIERAAAYRLGIVTHCIDQAHFQDIAAALADAETVDPLLDRLHRDPPATEPDSLRAHETLIEDIFGRRTLGDIFTTLETESSRGGPDAEWCARLLGELRTKCPMSLHVTLRHLDSVGHLDLRETLIQDYRLAVRCLSDGDFLEGVRAVLIDKDGLPKWRHGAIDAVAAADIAAHFEAPAGGDLELPTRQQMQDLRR